MNKVRLELFHFSHFREWIEQSSFEWQAKERSRSEVDMIVHGARAFKSKHRQKCSPRKEASGS